MSHVSWHRRTELTPRSPYGYSLKYFTPKKSSDRRTSSVTRSRQYLSVSISAEAFIKREGHKRYRFYQRAPSTPLYKKCQSIKRRLIFNDEDEKVKNTETQTSPTKYEKNNQSPSNFTPLIVISTPNESYSLYNEFNGKTSSQNSFQINKVQIPENGQNFKSEVKTVTPNMKCILNNISPLSNHKIIGKGRFGCVIEGFYKGVKVAIKVIKVSKKNMKASILGEQNGLGLCHPNISKVNMIVWPNEKLNGRYCIIMMDCCDNSTSLQHIIEVQSRHMSSRKILKYSNEICAALHYLHSCNILHLDVKPRNVLVCSNDVCKLCDFGTSIKYGECVERSDFIYQFRGTVQYCSPEILKCLQPSPASDVYSLGITMWQFLHGPTPYENELREESLIYKVVKEGLRPTNGERFPLKKPEIVPFIKL